MNKISVGKAVTVTLSPYIYKSLEEMANKKGLKKSAIVTIALEKYFREEERNKSK